MQIAPLIHSRTCKCDFNPKFLFRPNDLSETDIMSLREKILLTTTNIDTISGERWVVIDIDEGHTVAGIVCYLKDLVAKCKGIDKNEAEQYLTDEKGRSLYAFIGICIKDKKPNYTVDISYDYLWNIFKDNVQSVWDSIEKQSNSVDYIEDNTLIEEKIDLSLNKKTIINETSLYLMNENNDNDLFRKYLAENKSFCSNVTKSTQAASMLKIFSGLSTNQNTIDFLEVKIQELNLKPGTTDEKAKEHEHVEPVKPNRRTTSQKDTSNPNLVAAGIAAVVVIIVIYLIMKK